MRYVSLFSGIEAASVAWEPLGFRPLAFAEIEPFPCAVLAHRWPEVPNLGDVTKIDWAEFLAKHGRPDVVVGGPPCQAFSVAGLRKGLEDPRGNLTLTYLSAIDQLKPEFVVFENVPGIVSDRTGAFESFLDGLQQLGYLIDMDVLDAQFFGVAQRRKRVFVLGWRAESLLKKRTSTSRLIIAQILELLLRDTLAGLYQASGTGQEGSASQNASRDGHLKRMKSFGLQEAESLRTWLESLAGDHQRLAGELESLASSLGASFEAMRDMGDTKSRTSTEDELWFIGRLWRAISEEGSAAPKSSTTSTSTRTTTTYRIYTCATGLLLIARLTPHLMPSLPIFANEGFSISIGLKEFIEYAKRKNEQSSIFDGFDYVLDDLRREAMRNTGPVERVADRCTTEVLPEPSRLSGDHPSSREKREALAALAGRGTQGAGGGCLTPWDSQSRRVYDTGGAAPALQTRGASGGDAVGVLARAAGFKWHQGTSAGSVGYQPELSPTIQADKQPAVLGFCPGVSRTGTLTATEGLAPTLRTGAGTTLPAVAYAVDHKQTPKASEGVCHTLTHEGTGGIHSAVAWAQNQRDEAGLQGGDGSISGAVEARPGKNRTYVCMATGQANAEVAEGMAPTLNAAHEQPMVADGWVVRRLTPLECERLQGFPDGWTDIPYKGRDHPPDTPRYRALGNSMCVNVMRWIGKRIARLETSHERQREHG